jgi:hypothetical protein
MWELVTSLCKSLISPMREEDIIIGINENMKRGYQELLISGLISDPIIETTLFLTVLSFIPFSIVKRTKNGKVVYRKIQAAFWKYERQQRSGGSVQTNWTFEAIRIARAIKAGLTAGFHEATKEDEPDE